MLKRFLSILFVLILIGSSLTAICGSVAGDFEHHLVREFDTFPIDGSGLAIGDVNNDGYNDTVVLFQKINMFTLYLNDADGNLTREGGNNYTIPAEYKPVDITLGDVNNDGLLDVLIIDQNTNNLTIFNNSGSGRVYDNNTIPGDANLQIIEIPFNIWPRYDSVAVKALVGDLNNDGLNDTVVGQMSQGEGFSGFHILLNSNNQYIFDNDSNTSNVNPFQFHYSVGGYVFDIALGDVGEDSNGDLDVIVSGYSWQYSSWGFVISLNHGDGLFTMGDFYQFEDMPVLVQLADLDNDNDADIALSTWSPTYNYFGVLYNDGSGRLFDNDAIVGNTNLNLEQYSTDQNVQVMEIADIDLDNDQDLVILADHETLVIFENGLTGRLFDSDSLDNDVNDNYIEFRLSDVNSERLRLGNMDGKFGPDAVLVDTWGQEPVLVYIPLLGRDAGIWDSTLYNTNTGDESQNPTMFYPVGNYFLNVTVKNYGIYDASPFNVSLTILYTSNSSVYYFKNQTIAGKLDHFHLVNVTFNPDMSEGEYWLIIQTWLPNDQFSINSTDNNDIDNKSITIIDVIDMAVSGIIKPEMYPPIGFSELNVTLQNVGNLPAANFDLNFTIYDVEYSSPVFEDDMESGSAKWNTTGGDANNSWQQVTWQYNSPTTSWWFGNNSAKDQIADYLNGSLVTKDQINLSSFGFTPDTVLLKLNHSYDFELDMDEGQGGNPEIHPIEGGWVSVSTDGINWTTLQPEYGYPYKDFELGCSNKIGISDPSPYDDMGFGVKVNDFQGQEAFLMSSDGWITTFFDLGSYIGDNISLAFNYSGHNLRGLGMDGGDYGFENGSNGWWIDDIVVMPMNRTYNWSVETTITKCDVGDVIYETFGGAQWNASLAGEYLGVATLNYTDDNETANNVSSKHIFVNNINDVSSLGLEEPNGCIPPGSYYLNGGVFNPGNLDQTFPVNFTIEKYDYTSLDVIYFNNIDDPPTGSQSQTISMSTTEMWFRDDEISWSKERSLYCAWENERKYENNWEESVFLEDLNLSGITTERVVLSFFQEYGISAGDFGQVIITNQSEDFSDVLHTSTGISNGWEYVQIDLSQYKGFENLTIEFLFTSEEDNEGPGWHLDDINISARNYTMAHVWADEVTVTDLPSGENTTAISNLVWTPAVEGDYMVNVTTKLSNDGDDSNNKTTELLNVLKMVDASTLIINPGTMEIPQQFEPGALRALAGTAQTFNATVVNNGNIEQTFDVNCSIYLENWQYSDTIFYNDTYNATSGSQAGTISVGTTGQWQVDGTRSTAGATSWWCGDDIDDHDYENSTESSVEITNIDLSSIDPNEGTSQVLLSFDLWWDLADENDILWVNATNGSYWQTIWYITGNQQSWAWVRNLELYLPWFMYGESNCAIYFNFSTDASQNAEGIYLDRINLSNISKWQLDWWDEKNVTLSPGDKTDVTFKPWQVQETPPETNWDSDALIVVYTKLTDDMNEWNNDSMRPVYFYNLHDIGVESINEPPSGWVPQGKLNINATFANDGTTTEYFNGSFRISSNTTTEAPFDLMNDCSNITSDYGPIMSINQTTYQFAGKVRSLSSFLYPNEYGQPGSGWVFDTNGRDSTKCLEISKSATGQMSYWESSNVDTFESVLYLDGLAPWAKYMELSFWHNYSISKNFDSGVLLIQTDENNYTQQFPSPGYTGTQFSANNKGNDMPGWTGNSGGWIKETVNLTDYIGYKRLTLIFRFHLDTMNSNGSEWYIDDVNLRMINGTMLEENYGFFRADSGSGIPESTKADGENLSLISLGSGDYYVDVWVDHYINEEGGLEFRYDDTPENDLKRQFIKTDNIKPIAHAGWDTTINEDTLYQLDGSGSSDGQTYLTNYTWTFDDQGPRTLYNSAPWYNFANPGNFSLTLKVTDGSGLSDTDTVWVHVTDITLPLAAAGSDITQDEHTWVTFNGSGCNDNKPGGILNLTWTFDDHGTQVTLYGNTAKYFFTYPGNYTVTLSVKDEANNAAIDTLTVNINDTTAPEAKAGEDIETPEDEQIEFNGTLSSDNDQDHTITYKWTFDDRGTNVDLAGVMPKYTFDTPGIYTVTLTVYDYWRKLSDTDTLTVTVTDVTPPEVEAGPDKEVDEDKLATFNGNQTTDNDPEGALEYNWVFFDHAKNDDVKLTGVKPTYKFVYPGEYTVNLNVTDDAGNWAIDDLTVSVLDKTPPKIVGLGNVTILAGTKYILDASSCYDPEHGTIKSYKWNIDDSGSIIYLNGINVSYMFNNDGIMPVTLYLIDARGSNPNEATFYVTVTGGEFDVTSHYPTAIKNVPVDTNISTTFNRMADQAKCENAFSIDPSITGKFSWGNNNMTLTFTPDEPLAYGTAYKVAISSNAEDINGNHLNNSYTFQFSTVPPEGDSTAPTLKDWSPKGSNAPVDSLIWFTFSEAMDKTITEDGFDFSPVTAGKLSWDRNILVFTPDANLSFDTIYTVTLSKTTADLSGNTLKESFMFTFLTEPLTGTTRPDLLFVSPKPGSSKIPIDTMITYTFDSAIDPSDFGLALVSSKGTVDTTRSYDSINFTLIFTPNSPLSKDTLYTTKLANLGPNFDVRARDILVDGSFSFSTVKPGEIPKGEGALVITVGDDGEVITGVTVTVKLDDAIVASGQTNDTGTFLTYLPPGTYTLIIEYEGYTTETKLSIDVGEGATTYLEIPMDKEEGKDKTDDGGDFTAMVWGIIAAVVIIIILFMMFIKPKLLKGKKPETEKVEEEDEDEPEEEGDEKDGEEDELDDDETENNEKTK